MAIEKKEPNILPAGINCIYFNGFSILMGNADISITLQLHGRDILALNTSFTVAKTLHLKLGEMIGILEKQSGHPIMSTDDITQYLQRETGGRK